MIEKIVTIIVLVFASIYLGYLWTMIISGIVSLFCKLTIKEEPDFNGIAFNFANISNIILIFIALCFTLHIENTDTDSNSKIESLEAELEEKETEYNNLSEDYENLQSKYDELQSNYEDVETYTSDDYNIEEKDDGTLILTPNQTYPIISSEE